MLKLAAKRDLELLKKDVQPPGHGAEEQKED
jgi:hypothetical protein